MEDPKREKPRRSLLTTGFNQQNSEVATIASKAKSLIPRSIPEPPSFGLVKLRMLKSINDILTSASVTGDPIPDFENLDFKICKRTQEDLNREASRNKSPQSKAKLKSLKRSHRLPSTLVATMKPSWPSEIYRKFNERTTTFRPSAQWGRSMISSH